MAVSSARSHIYFITLLLLLLYHLSYITEFTEMLVNSATQELVYV